jgi:hypothetical protein
MTVCLHYVFTVINVYAQALLELLLLLLLLVRNDTIHYYTMQCTYIVASSAVPIYISQ